MEEEIIEPKWKKVVLLITGIVVILFLLVYFVLGNILGIAQGLLVSSSLDENRVEMLDRELIFVNESYDELLGLYHDNLGKEFKACLLGWIDGDYYVDEIHVPFMSFQKHNQVISHPCPKVTLIDLHSHPDNHCLFSEQDFSSFGRSRENFTVMAVLCNEARFNFYK